jgi:hypothetical protein
MSTDLMHAMIPFFGCIIERTPEGVRLTGASRNHLNAIAITPEVFRAPFTLKTVARTDSTNVRLYWHLGEIIFNWECSIRQLRFHDPGTGKQIGIQDAGFIAIDQWHEIVWEVKPGSMRLLVDGELRLECTGDWGNIEAPLAIGPCFGSTVTVQSFAVEQG